MTSSSQQDTCDELFMHALETIKTLTHLSNTSSVPKPQLKDRINLYGIYKQATEGDVNKEEPDRQHDHAGHTKWVAWKSNKGTPPKDAKKRYVKRLISVLNSYGDEYQQVSQLRDTIQLYWEQYNSKGKKYGDISYTSPPTTGVVISSKSIMRAHSPAASLYRIASTGVNRSTSKLNRSRSGSFSGTTLNTTTTSPINQINTQPKWHQQQQQKQHHEIEHIDLHVKDMDSMRFVSQSTTHSPISNDKKKSSDSERNDRSRRIQVVFTFIKNILRKVASHVNSGLARDIIIVLLVILVQRTSFFNKTTKIVQNHFLKLSGIASSLFNSRSLK